MTMLSAEFGYYPRPLDFTAGSVTVATLPDLVLTVTDIKASETVDGDWIYSGPQLTKNLGGPIRERPYPARVFGLPKTHRIDHSAADDEAHLDFHVWALSFFLGMRLTTTEAGFLDATPLKPGKLTDFILLGRGEEKIPVLAEGFWTRNKATPANAKRWIAAVHALFLAQNRQSLQFERFIYLYTALDACYALAAAMTAPPRNLRHSERIHWLCQLYGIAPPQWAALSAKGKTKISDIRNPTLHEGLFIGEPLGFAIHGAGSDANLTLEMQALVCRFLAALIGVTDTNYVTSGTDSRQRHPLRL